MNDRGPPPEPTAPRVASRVRTALRPVHYPSGTGLGGVLAALRAYSRVHIGSRRGVAINARSYYTHSLSETVRQGDAGVTDT